MKKKTGIIILVALLASLLFVKAEAAGQGNDPSWEIKEGVLYVYGGAELKSYESGTDVPWHEKKAEIKEVVLQNGVVAIGDYLFADCVNMKTITMPATLKRIGSYAFSGCAALEIIEIPNGVQSIGAGAFTDCTGITEVQIQNLSLWCAIDFADTEANPLNRSAALRVNGDKLSTLVVPGGITQIKPFAFTGLKVTHVRFAGEVTAIGERAFAGSSLEQIEFPQSLVSIGKEAFMLSALRGVAVPCGVRELGDRAFSRCFYMTSAQLFGGNEENEGISSGTETFSGCTALRHLFLENGITEVGKSCCYSAALRYVYLADTVSCIRENAFKDCNELVEINYNGAESRWNLVQVEGGNDLLKTAPVVFPDKTCTHQFPSWQDTGNGTHKGTCSLCGFEETKEHYYPVRTVTKFPTCAQIGTEEGYCGDCNYHLVVELPKTNNHSYKNDCDRDCNECGAIRSTSHVYSSVCDEMCDSCFEERQVEHSWDEGNVASQPTCSLMGEAYYKCTVCGKTKMEYLDKLGHDLKETSVTDGGCEYGKRIEYKCTRCYYECVETIEIPHSFTDLESRQEATCSREGLEVYRCKTCAAKETRAIPKDPAKHTYSVACDVNCDECGAIRQVQHSYDSKWKYDSASHWQECKVCKEKKDAAAHIPGPAATEKTGQYCAVCNYMMQGPLGHIHDIDGSFTGDATGHWMSCKTCKEKVEPKEHSFTGPCDELCDACSYRRQTDHMIKLGWASNETHHWQYCLGCGQTGEKQVHQMDAGTVVTEPGPGKPGWKQHTCVDCGAHKQVEIPALPGGQTEPSESTGSTEDTTSPQWSSDEKHHWGADGEKLEHNWDEGTLIEVSGQILTQYVCEDCGMQKNESGTNLPGNQTGPTGAPEPDRTEPNDPTAPTKDMQNGSGGGAETVSLKWGAPILAVLAAVVVAVILIRKKKK